MSKKLLIFWAYVVEIFLSSIIMSLAFLVFEYSEVVEFSRTASKDIATNFAVVMLAASLGLFWTFYSKSDSPFVQWLHEKRAFEVYAWSFLFSIGVYVFLVLFLILTTNISSDWISIVSLWLFVLGLINVYSLIKNTYDLMRLNALFNRKSKES